MSRRAPWGTARIEVIALADEIRSEAARGIPLLQIYKRLRAEGRITMARSAFYQWAKELGTPKTASESRPIPPHATEKYSNRTSPARLSPPPGEGKVASPGLPRLTIVQKPLDAASEATLASAWDGEGFDLPALPVPACATLTPNTDTDEEKEPPHGAD